MIFIISSFFFRILISFYNYFYGPIPGAEFDALAFHEEAVFYSDYIDQKYLGIQPDYDYRIGWYYSNFLGFFYNIFENYQMLYASIFSCIAWLLSSLILIKILKIFEVNKKDINLILFIYCWLFPTSIIYNSITLREPYMLFLFNCLILIFINIYLKGANILRIILFIIVLIPFTLLHDANIFFAMIFTAITLSLFILKKFIKKNTTFFLCITVLFISLITEIIGLGLNEFFFKKIISYRKGHFEFGDFARAFYVFQNDLISLKYDYFTNINFIIANYFNYMVQPLPWKANSLKDIVMIMENILRFILYIFILLNILNYKKKNFDKKLVINYLTIALILMEFIYAQATINWGSASRHHSVSMGILIVLAFINQKRYNLKFSIS